MPKLELDVEPGNCRACAAPVWFVRSATSDARLILDAGSKKRVVVVDQSTSKLMNKSDMREATNPALFDVAKTKPRAHVVDTFLDHHTVCPSADRFRKDKAGSRA